MLRLLPMLWRFAVYLGVFLSTASAHAQGAPQDPNNDNILIDWAVLAMVILAAYFLPAIVAFVRRHPNRWPILVINTVFGLTGLGWLGSLIWACGVIHISPSGNHGGESGLNLFVNDPARPARQSAARPMINHEPDPADELRRLKALHDAGALNDAEYQRLRTDPLTRLTGLPSDMP